MKLSNFLRRAGLVCAMGFVLLGVTATWAQDDDAPEPIVSAPKIIEALTAPKDIVPDRPGAMSRPRPSARRDAAIDLYVQFTFGSADLMPHGKRQLDELAMALNDRSLNAFGFLLGGHTDRVGDANYNIRLSLLRANAVKAYLAEVHGMPLSRLQTVGYGFSRLLNPAHPTAAINRRVEVRLLASSGTPVYQNGDDRLVPTPR